MDARNLIWIIPVTAIMFFIVGISFVDYDLNITMDDNTRIALESLSNINQSIVVYNNDNKKTYLVFENDNYNERPEPLRADSEEYSIIYDEDKEVLE